MVITIGKQTTNKEAPVAKGLQNDSEQVVSNDNKSKLETQPESQESSIDFADISQVVDLAQKMAANGYSAVPLMRKEKYPLMKGWQHLCDTSLTSDEIPAVFNEHNAGGVGIACGGVISIDADCLDKEVAAEVGAIITKHLGKPGMVREGMPPKRQYFYRPKNNETVVARKIDLGGAYKGKLEILAKGNQAVAFGIHKDTHKPYKWFGNNPLNTKSSELPEVTQTQVNDLIAELEIFYPHNVVYPKGFTPQQFTLGDNGKWVDGRETGLLHIVWKVCNDKMQQNGSINIEECAKESWGEFIQKADTTIAKGGTGKDYYQYEDAVKKVKYAATRVQKVGFNDSPFLRYSQFFAEHLPEAMRDKISDGMYFKKNGKFESVDNNYEILLSHAHDHKLSLGHLRNHMERWYADKPIGLTISIPCWDGIDRVSKAIECLNITNIAPKLAEELIKAYCASMLQRMDDSHVQNTVLALVGPQNMGKDYWIRQVFGGLGKYYNQAVVSKDERERFIVLASSGLVHIEEFEKLNELGAASIKDMITRPSAFLRMPYARAPKKYPIRCSFAVSSNEPDILIDYTGNRRFSIFQVDSIDRSYPKDVGMQYIAQMQHLANQGYEASKEAVDAMAAYIASVTPDSPNAMWLEQFDDEVKKLEKMCHKKVFEYSDIIGIVKDLAGTYGLKVNKMLQSLKKTGRNKRTNEQNTYFAKL